MVGVVHGVTDCLDIGLDEETKLVACTALVGVFGWEDREQLRV